VASDADLVRDALSGAKEPLGELLSRHWPTAVALATRVLGSADLARDAAQEAAIAAMTDLAALRSPDRFGAWFCGIALNVSRRWLRQLRAELRAGPPDPAADSPGPAEQAETAELVARVRAAVSDLPPGQRDAVWLFYLQGLTHREVAADLRISIGAVKARLHQARASLAPALAELAADKKGTDMTVTETEHWSEVTVSGILRGKAEDVLADWQETVRQALVARRPGDHGDHDARVRAAVVMTGFRVALEDWLAGSHPDLAHSIEGTMRAVEGVAKTWAGTGTSNGG